MLRPFSGRFHDQVAPVAPLRLPLKPVGVSVSPKGVAESLTRFDSPPPEFTVHTVIV